jgi:hypothetical protein
MTTISKDEFIREHLPYELMMLRYTHKRLLESPRKLDENALIESFAVHGRNLLDFLYLPADSKSYWAADFCDIWLKQRFDKATGIIYGTMHDQILHMGQKRVVTDSGKFGPAERVLIRDKIEIGFTKFVPAIKTEYRALWNADLADPTKMEILVLSTELADPSATITINNAPPGAWSGKPIFLNVGTANTLHGIAIRATVSK